MTEESICYDKSNYHYNDNEGALEVFPQPSLTKALAQRDDAVWKELSTISLGQAVDYFLATLTVNTRRAYRAAFSAIFELFRKTNVFSPDHSLQTLALSNLDYLLDEVRNKISGTDATKQARAAAFISLTRYLQRSTGGVIQKAVPKRDKGNPTFRQVRETSHTQSLTKNQWCCFLLSLKRLSYRDYLVAKTILQGAKRVGEVLTAQINQIDWTKNQITFRQFKSKVIEKCTIITYPESFMKELREYIGDRLDGPIFITRRGRRIAQPHLYRSFSKAGQQAGISFTVHPHVLRASAITFFSSIGYHADQIIRVSGHADEKLVKYYDKTPIEQNPTKDISLI